MCLQPAHLAHKLQDHRFRVPDPSRLLDDLLTLLGKASVSIVDGLDFSIEIRFATPSIEFRREAVNAY